MKKQYILMGATIVFAALFASCSQENNMDEAFSQSEKEIIFDLGISQTRTVTIDKKTSFEDGDHVGIYGLKRGATEVLHANLDYHYTADNGKWVAEYSITFPIDVSELNFYAYYPYNDDLEGTSFDFSVSQDQSKDGYNQSDLLLAKNETASVDDESITLSFVHKLALVEAEVILPEGEVIKNVDICAKRTATVNLTEQTAIVKASEAAEYITMQPVEGNVFRAVVPAQSMSKGKVFRITAEDGAIYWYKTTESMELVENKISAFSIDCTGSSL